MTRTSARSSSGSIRNSAHSAIAVSRLNDSCGEQRTAEVSVCVLSRSSANGESHELLGRTGSILSNILVAITTALRFATAVIAFTSTVTTLALRVRQWLRLRRDR